MPSITIIGPGAIGGTVAAWLAQDKANQISICARTPFDELRLETPQGDICITPRLFTAPEQAGEAAWVLIATKTYDVAGTAQWFPRLVGPSTRVAILQNGVEHIQRFTPFIDPKQLLPVVVDLPAEKSGPGRIRQRGVGNLIVPDHDNGRAFVQLFAATPLNVTSTDDFRTQVWRKLALNCTGIVPALLLRSVDVNQNPGIVGLIRMLIRECIQVGRAEGAVLADTLEEEIIARYRQGPANTVNSLHADRLAGRPLETDARNGAVVRIGERHGIDTPMNRLMIALLTAATQTQG
jgi:2-dehydropantoate 2-reductase